MEKKVGNFTGSVGAPHPCWCEINDGQGGYLRFDHRSLSDLEYLVDQMKEAAFNLLPDNSKSEI